MSSHTTARARTGSSQGASCRRLFSLAVCMLTGFACLNAVAAWQSQPAVDSTPDRAVSENGEGEQLSIYRGPGAELVLELKTRLVHGLYDGSCPTFQIDTRTPQHHYLAGAGCRIDGAFARYIISDQSRGTIESLVVYRLMNGNQVTFRYQSKNGNYHQSRFSLSRSKQAMRNALGNDFDAQPGQDE